MNNGVKGEYVSLPGRLHMTLIYSTIVKVCNRTGMMLSTARSQTLRYPLKTGKDFPICDCPSLSTGMLHGKKKHELFYQKRVMQK